MKFLQTKIDQTFCEGRLDNSFQNYFGIRI